MSRSGYCEDIDDQWALIRWRGAVNSALRGKRGQSFLKEMRDAMDALPEKRLVAHELEDRAGVCAIGAVGKARGVDMSKLDAEDYDRVAAAFGIAPALAQEIVFMNDERWDAWNITPEDRFHRMRAWIERKITKPAEATS